MLYKYNFDFYLFPYVIALFLLSLPYVSLSLFLSLCNDNPSINLFFINS